MAKQQATDKAPALTPVMVAVDKLTEHPRNYRSHPEPQVAEIAASIEQFGQYKPVVVSSDGVILAGHGVVRGARAQGRPEVAAVFMPFAASDPKAEKLIVADNELSRMAEDDGTALASLLADIQRTEGLQGTGYDDAGLSKLIGDLAAEDYSAKVPPEEFPDVDPSDDAFAHKCPRCNFEWNEPDE